MTKFSFPSTFCVSIFGLAAFNASIEPPQPPMPATSNSFGARVTERRPNVRGSVLILMYHHIGKEEKFMFRSEENLRKDFKRLHEMGYRPVTMQEYAEDRMPLPPGASPVILTWDDSHRDQFNILPDGTIDPKCVVGVWLDFAKDHPDFPVKATWYVNNNGPWGQHELSKKKVDMLLSWGSEIGNHTANHKNLKKLSDEEVKKEIADCTDMLRKLGVEPVSFCYPYGNRPNNMEIMEEGFTQNGKRYSFLTSTLAGSAPAYSVRDRRFRAHHVWRVHAFPGDQGVDWWLNAVAKGESKPYVQP